MVFLGDTMYKDNRNWDLYNEQLGKRGGILSFLLQNVDFERELRTRNRGKRGRPYLYPESIIQLGFSLKCIFHLGYRQLKYFMEDISALLHFSIPNFRTLWWRIDNLERQKLKSGSLSEKKLDIAVDSTGLKLENDGEYRTTKYGKRKIWTKMHANVNVKTQEALNIIITKDNVGDSKKFKALIEPIKENVSSVRADKGYDTSKNFEYCKKNRIAALIPVKINAIPSGRGARQEAVREQLEIPVTHARLNSFDKPKRRIKKQKNWKKRVRYGFRWVVEVFYSRFKRIFGEYVFSRKWKNIEKEVVTKVNILNLFTVLR